MFLPRVLLLMSQQVYRQNPVEFLISENTFVQKHEANWSSSSQTKELFQKWKILQSVEIEWIKTAVTNQQDVGQCVKERRSLFFTDSAQCSYSTWIFHVQFSHDSVDTVVLAAQLQMCEDQNSIPIITLPIYYLFYKLWGINNETCTLYISQSSRSLFNLGSSAHIISHMMVQESKAKSNHTEKLNPKHRQTKSGWNNHIKSQRNPEGSVQTWLQNPAKAH